MDLGEIYPSSSEDIVYGLASTIVLPPLAAFALTDNAIHRLIQEVDPLSLDNLFSVIDTISSSSPNLWEGTQDIFLFGTSIDPLQISSYGLIATPVGLSFGSFSSIMMPIDTIIPPSLVPGNNPIFVFGAGVFTEAYKTTEINALNVLKSGWKATEVNVGVITPYSKTEINAFVQQVKTSPTQLNGFVNDYGIAETELNIDQLQLSGASSTQLNAAVQGISIQSIQLNTFISNYGISSTELNIDQLQLSEASPTELNASLLAISFKLTELNAFVSDRTFIAVEIGLAPIVGYSTASTEINAIVSLQNNRTTELNMFPTLANTRAMAIGAIVQAMNTQATQLNATIHLGGAEVTEVNAFINIVKTQTTQLNAFINKTNFDAFQLNAFVNIMDLGARTELNAFVRDYLIAGAQTELNAFLINEDEFLNPINNLPVKDCFVESDYYV